jgi:hypothetical protein
MPRQTAPEDREVEIDLQEIQDRRHDVGLTAQGLYPAGFDLLPGRIEKNNPVPVEEFGQGSGPGLCGFPMLPSEFDFPDAGSSIGQLFLPRRYFLFIPSLIVFRHCFCNLKDTLLKNLSLSRVVRIAQVPISV